jgi:hypothetical protein
VIDAVFSTYPATAASSCTCSKHEFRSGSINPSTTYFEGSCLTCPDGTLCEAAAISTETLPVLPGYWRSSNSSQVVTKCIETLSCVGDSVCADGHTGPLCSVCARNYEKNVVGVCQGCDDGTKRAANVVYAGLLWGFVVSIVLWMVFSCAKNPRRRGNSEEDAEEEERRLRLLRENKGWRKKAVTKCKILFGFYQVVGPIAETLQLRFPPAYTRFVRFMYAVSSFDVMQVTSWGCIFHVNFYSTLVFATVGPFILAAVVCLIWGVYYRQAKSQEKKANIIYMLTSSLISLTYVVCTRVSITLFEMFNCQNYGDDPTLYMMVDPSISCETADHKWYQNYAACMIVLYPVGIPLLYLYLLYGKRRLIINGNEKDTKIAFLTDMYKPKAWWWDIFDVLRRLALTSGLVIAKPALRGVASLTNLGNLLSVLSVVAVIHYKPFRKGENDQIAWVSQVATFFTFIGALLIKTNVDVADGYDQNIFAGVFIFVNSIALGIVMFDLVLGKPLKKLIINMSRRHYHNAPLKDIPHKAMSIEQFQEYCMRVAKSTSDEAGWETLEPKDWRPAFGMSAIAAEEWMRASSCVGHWRNAAGNGPLDQCRTTTILEGSIEDVFNFVYAPETGIAAYYILSQHDGRRTVYRAIEMPWPLSARDFLLEDFLKEHGEKGDADYEIMLCCRSFVDEQVMSHKETHMRGRVRGDIKDGGVLLQKHEGNEHLTKMTRWVNCDLGGWFGGDWMARITAPINMRESVDDYITYCEWCKMHPDSRPTRDDYMKGGMKRTLTNITGTSLSEREMQKMKDDNFKEQEELKKKGKGSGMTGIVHGNDHHSDDGLEMQNMYDPEDHDNEKEIHMMGGLGVPPPPDIDDIVRPESLRGLRAGKFSGKEMNPMFVTKMRAESVSKRSPSNSPKGSSSSLAFGSSRGASEASQGDFV